MYHWELSVLNRIYKTKAFKQNVPESGLNSLKNKKAYQEQISKFLKDLGFSEYRFTENSALYKGDIQKGFQYFSYETNYLLYVMSSCLNIESKFMPIENLSLAHNSNTLINSQDTQTIENFLLAIQRKLLDLLLGSESDLLNFIKNSLEPYLSCGCCEDKSILRVLDTRSKAKSYKFDITLYDIMLLSIIFNSRSIWDHREDLAKEFPNSFSYVSHIIKTFEVKYIY